MRKGMTFSEFFEIFDPMQGAPATGELRQMGTGSYNYKFKIDDDVYDVVFQPSRSLDLENGFSILFRGPQATQLTGKNIAGRVYGEMMAGIQKFIEQVKPSTVNFSGAESAMDLVYHRLFKKFNDMAPEDQKFLRVDQSNYIRKEIYEHLPPLPKQRIDEKINRWQGREAGYLDIRRREKLADRQRFQKVSSYTGGFFEDYNGRIALIYKVTPRKVHYFIRKLAYTGDEYIASPKYEEMEDISPNQPMYKASDVQGGKVPLGTAGNVVPLLRAVFNKPGSESLLRSIPADIIATLRQISELSPMTGQSPLRRAV